MSTALTTKQQASYGDTRGLLQRMKDEIKTALPKHIDADRFIRVALTTIRKTPKLLECSQESLLSSLMTASQLGLEVDGVLGHAYLIPYGREATLVPGYRGLIALARRSGDIESINTCVVYEGDEFDYQLGDEPYIRHKRGADVGETWTHVYAVVRLKDGGVQRSVWTRSQVLRHRDKYCKNRKPGGPWDTAEEQMARKTVLRDMVARGELPVSAEVVRMAVTEEQWEATTITQQPVDRLSQLTESLTLPAPPANPWSERFAAATDMTELDAARQLAEADAGEHEYDDLMDAYETRAKELSS